MAYIHVTCVNFGITRVTAYGGDEGYLEAFSVTRRRMAGRPDGIALGIFGEGGFLVFQGETRLFGIVIVGTLDFRVAHVAAYLRCDGALK